MSMKIIHLLLAYLASICPGKIKITLVKFVR